MNKKRGLQAGISRPALRRLLVYYHCLLEAIKRGDMLISSNELGQYCGVAATLVRKDISSCLPKRGRPGIGYDVLSLAAYLEELLGLINDKEAVLVGVGKLGSALALYPGFNSYKLRIIALFDNDPTKIGEKIGDYHIFPVRKLPSLARRLYIQIGIITVPAGIAQNVADTMVDAGIKVVWNFAPCRLMVPDGVFIQNMDLAADLAALSHYVTRRKVAMSLETADKNGSD